MGGTRLDENDHLIKTKDGYIAGTDLFGGGKGMGDEGSTVTEASAGPSEVVLDTFNLSTYSNMQRLTDKTDSGYMV